MPVLTGETNVPPLVMPEDLASFPGAPFTQEQINSAAGQVRAECGWHVAPSVTETLRVDCEGGRVLVLPTLRLADVTAVRDATGDTPRVLDGWRKSSAGMLSRAGGWPSGFEAVEVDVTHGYAECPPELLPIIAERCQMFAKDGSVRQESLGSRSVSYGFLEGTSSASVLARFKLGPRP